MTEQKTTCRVCDAEIQIATAERTDGLCMPCKNGTRKKAELKGPPMVSCAVSSHLDVSPTFVLECQELLNLLETTRHMGDSSHPNRIELEAQRALLRHAIRHKIDWRLNDDHWGRTGYAILSLFERGKATMRYEGSQYSFADILKDEWSDVHGPLCGTGGFLYRTPVGVTLFKISTWVS